MRCFVALELPEEIRDQLAEVQESLETTDAFEGKLTETENLHLTLKFLGDVDERDLTDIEERLAEINWGNISAEIDYAGVFSRKFIRIIWMRLKGAEALQKKVDLSLLDLFNPERRFMSHITLARVKKVKDKEALLKKVKETKLEGAKFTTGTFYLMKSELTSEGPTYTVLKKFKANG